MTEQGRGPDQVSLVATTGETLEVFLGQGVNMVGRQPEENTLVLTSPAVSRYHDLGVVTERAIYLRDLGSANGTFHNGERVVTAQLQAGDLVGFSDVFTFRVHVACEAASVETAAEGEFSGAPTNMWEQTGPLFEEGAVEPLRTGESAVARAPSEPPPVGPELPAQANPLQTLEGDGFQLAAILELSERAGSLDSLEQLERLMVRVLDGLLSCQRGFITYHLPGGDWKLLMVARPHAWDRREVRRLLQLALRESKTEKVPDSRRDDRLGAATTEQGDARVLVPLRAQDRALGAVFLVTPLPHSIDARVVRLLEHYARTVSSAIVRLTSR